ncbi:LAGLIDADG family homing endonuclease [Streptomyces sp. H39-S7]|uniref:LAGLIDADG family homing endonuclease n=1 Tax=Streptomyces sp. H39-S7 TaxID=3004357 RepID=UPI0022AFC3AF|nr:LAGLIDADG family homing endonuclease [Streptomyces sp. H39-S7]MCZ4119552.1 hypothetical protein [Streptomyces sp. H39-S7]
MARTTQVASGQMELALFTTPAPSPNPCPAVDATLARQRHRDSAGLPLEAPILSTHGWVANRDLAIGDRLIDPCGQDSTVVALYRGGVNDIYRIRLQDDTEALASLGQAWEISARDSNNRRKTEIVSTLEMKKRVDKKYWQVLLPKPVSFTYDAASELPIHPYLMGILLAEGSLSDETLTFASGDSAIVQRVASILPEGVTVKPSNPKPDNIKFRISVGNWGGAQIGRNTTGRNVIISALRALRLWGTRSDTKFIPEIYLRADTENRLELLRGLMDGDGSIKKDGNIRYSTASEELALGIRELAWSLGGRAKISLISKTYKYQGEMRIAKDAYQFNGVCGLTTNPFWL